MSSIKQIEWGLIIALLILLIYAATAGAKNVKHVALLEAFSAEDVARIEAKQEISDKITRFFKDSFYKMSAVDQMQMAERFFNKEIAPLAAPLGDVDYTNIRGDFLDTVRSFKSHPTT